MSWPVVHIEKAEAESALRAAAFESDESSSAIREIVKRIKDGPIVQSDGLNLIAYLHLRSEGHAAILAESTVKAFESVLRRHGIVHRRSLIHTYSASAFIGADWNLDEALAFLAEATEVAWASHPMNHDLSILSDGRCLHFGVPRPERAAVASG